MSSGCLHERHHKPGSSLEGGKSGFLVVTSAGVEHELSLQMTRSLNQTQVYSVRNDFLVVRGGWKMNSSEVVQQCFFFFFTAYAMPGTVLGSW